MVNLGTNGIVYIDGKRVGVCKSLTIDRKLNEETVAVMTTYSRSFELTGYAAERVASAIGKMSVWLHENARRRNDQARVMRQWMMRRR